MYLKRSALLILLIGVLVLADQVTKAWVLSEPVFNAYACFDRTVRCGMIELSNFGDFVMVWNRGMSFGLMQSDGFMRWVLVGLVGAVTTGFFVWMIRTASNVTATAMAFIVSGAIGNLIDRVRFGAVVDFLSLDDLYFPYVFNVADVWVNVGAALLFLVFFVLSDKEDEKSGG